MKIEKLNYEPEIDFLRFLAVTCVFFYHLKLLFPNFHLLGGFLGVDIFFFISGYLITKIILSKIINKEFSYKNFLINRFLRLVPGQAMLIILVFFSSLFILLPNELVQLSEQIIFSFFLNSNFYFWFFVHERYGDPGPFFQPLLHFWTLSVEWHFYIFYPLMIILFVKILKINFLKFLITITIISFILTLWASTKYKSAIFYLSVFRFWEFFLGGLTFYLFKKSENKKKLNTFFLYLIKILPTAGLFLIIYSVFNFNSQSSFFIRMYPIIGSILIIKFGTTTLFFSKIINFFFFIKIGRLSYSIYLYHFPFFCFYAHYLQIYEDNPFLKGMLIILTLICSVLSFQLIEKPFQKKFRK